MAKVLARGMLVDLVRRRGRFGAGPIEFATNRSSPYVQITLRQQLEKGLKCRRPVEFQFVDHVADLVDQGKLPIDMVNKCFDWSRQKNSFRPFVYFARSLTIMAEQNGFSL